MSALSVRFRPHWLNGWWLWWFTDPFLEIDGAAPHGGDVTRCSWSGATEIEVTPGHHSVRTFVRYRRFVLGDGGRYESEAVIDFPDATEVAVAASNGATNGSPFTLRLVPARRAAG